MFYRSEDDMKQMVAWIASAVCMVSLVFGASAAGRGQVRVDQDTHRSDDQPHRGAEELGPFSEWSEPVNLGATVNSPFIDWFPAISPNGLSLYISSNRPGGFGGSTTLDIWVSQRASRDDPWGSPVNLGSTINTSGNEFLPNLSPDGHWMFFTSNRAGGCGASDLWVAWRHNREDDFGWEDPRNLGCTINSPVQDNAPNFFRDRQTGITSLYFVSPRPDGVGSWDVYASMLRADGSFGAPALVWELSTAQMDFRSAIRRDGLEMLFYSDRPGGVGSFDLWVSTRQTTRDAWSRPVNLGPIVNSAFQDRGPALSRNGTTLYFNSDRRGGFGDQDLYVTTRRRLVGTAKD